MGLPSGLPLTDPTDGPVVLYRNNIELKLEGKR